MTDDDKLRNIDSVKKALGNLEWKYKQNDDDERVFWVSNVKSETRVFDLRIFASASFLVLNFKLNLVVPEPKRISLYETLDSVNKKLPIGNFETYGKDLVGFKLGVPGGRTAISSEAIETAIFLSSMSVDRFAPLIETVLTPVDPDFGN